ncbi:23S rRNA (adenine(2030)-N(6))-methyltransferase RlmJ [Neptuniibacter sp.]|uniref:23S rRNA (adenine(2030)-N(6))-methyltransferase RlmJ n=1 Tax=Neptuniibacter sp. TaxID=1962643 RepID=UPI00261CD88C|nr:23S rRNA (adenine(2030)-N(6))-methyltransferase RlmJ [Neptuniibacter sp.]MCP4597502.1 23S rRNA (adenine(2030)-N(6))-methyltransferase RlmJ [Neptuniibacter sp.]
MAEIYLHNKYAGGDADVVKHACLASSLSALLSALPEKTPYFETHAGAGCYSLQPNNPERQNGIKAVAPLLAEHALFTDFSIALARSGYESTGTYPGSAYIAACSGAIGQLSLCENNPAIADALQLNIPKADVYKQDGFESFSLVKPGSLVFIDPPYKSSDDYISVISFAEQLKKAGIEHVVLWYPLISAELTANMLDLLHNLFEESCSVTVHREPAQEGKMTGYGMFGSSHLLTQNWQQIIELLQPQLPITQIEFRDQ